MRSIRIARNALADFDHYLVIRVLEESQAREPAKATTSWYGWLLGSGAGCIESIEFSTTGSGRAITTAGARNPYGIAHLYEVHNSLDRVYRCPEFGAHQRVAMECGGYFLDLWSPPAFTLLRDAIARVASMETLSYLTTKPYRNERTSALYQELLNAAVRLARAEGTQALVEETSRELAAFHEFLIRSGRVFYSSRGELRLLSVI